MTTWTLRGACAYCGAELDDAGYLANGHHFCDEWCYSDALVDDYHEAVADAAIDAGYHNHSPF